MREITPASDLFSMGIILYEALTGRKPFARNTVQDTMEAVLKFMPPPVSETQSEHQSVGEQGGAQVPGQATDPPLCERARSGRDLAEGSAQ